MKKTLFLSVIAIVFAFFSTAINAQEWKWGVGSRCEGALLNASRIAVDKNGNTYASGILVPSFTIPWDLLSCSFGSHTVTGGGMILTSTDSNGNFRWVLRSKLGQIFDLAVDTADNVYIFGYCSGTVKLGNDSLVTNLISSNAYCAKIGSNGVAKWIKNVADSAFGFCGGVDAEGNVYIAGEYREDSIKIGATTLFHSGPLTTSDIFLAKLDSNGDNIWAHNLSTDSSDQLFALDVTREGAVHVAGSYKTSGLTIGSDVLPFPAGRTAPAFFLAQFNSDGTPLWTNTMMPGGEAFLKDVSTDSAGNIYITGGYANNIIFQNDSLPGNNTAWLHGYLARYSRSGALQWVTSPATQHFGLAWSVAPDNSGNIWIGGAANYGPTTYPFYMLRYTASGTLYDSTFLTAGGLDNSQLATDNRGNVYLCSDYGTTMYVGPDTLSLAPNALGAMFIAKYGYPLQAVSVSGIQRVMGNVNVYPNPASGSILNIDADNKEYSNFSIINAVGQTLLIQPMASNHTQADVADIPAGIYYITVKGRCGTQVRKWTKVL